MNLLLLIHYIISEKMDGDLDFLSYVEYLVSLIDNFYQLSETLQKTVENLGKFFSQ